MEAEGGNTKEEIDKTFFSQSQNHLQQLLTNGAITDPYQAFFTNFRPDEKNKEKDSVSFIYHNCFSS